MDEKRKEELVSKYGNDLVEEAIRHAEPLYSSYHKNSDKNREKLGLSLKSMLSGTDREKKKANIIMDLYGLDEFDTFEEHTMMD